MFYSKTNSSISGHHLERRTDQAEPNGFFYRSVVGGHTLPAMVLGGSEDFVLLPFSGFAAGAGEEDLVYKDMADRIRLVGRLGDKRG